MRQTEHRRTPPRAFSVAARTASFRHAFRGVLDTLRTQHNARIHAAFTVAVCAVGAWLELTRLEWSALVLAMAVVWAAELSNTALELLCDVVSPEAHPLVARAKDAAAGAVLIAAAGAAVVGLLVLGPPLWARIG